MSDLSKSLDISPERVQTPPKQADTHREVFKSPKVSSLYRSIEQQKLIGCKLPNQIVQTQTLYNQTLNVLSRHDISGDFPIVRRISQKIRDIKKRASVDGNENLIFSDKYESKKV